MFIVHERRTGVARRVLEGKPPAGFGERRVAERRQMIITNISFSEWASHFASFQQALATTDDQPSLAGRQVAANDEGRQE